MLKNLSSHQSNRLNRKKNSRISSGAVESSLIVQTNRLSEINATSNTDRSSSSNLSDKSNSFKTSKADKKLTTSFSKAASESEIKDSNASLDNLSRSSKTSRNSIAMKLDSNEEKQKTNNTSYTVSLGAAKFKRIGEKNKEEDCNEISKKRMSLYSSNLGTLNEIKETESLATLNPLPTIPPNEAVLRNDVPGGEKQGGSATDERRKLYKRRSQTSSRTNTIRSIGSAVSQSQETNSSGKGSLISRTSINSSIKSGSVAQKSLVTSSEPIHSGSIILQSSALINESSWRESYAPAKPRIFSGLQITSKLRNLATLEGKNVAEDLSVLKITQRSYFTPAADDLSEEISQPPADESNY